MRRDIELCTTLKIVNAQQDLEALKEKKNIAFVETFKEEMQLLREKGRVHEKENKALREKDKAHRKEIQALREEIKHLKHFPAKKV